MSLADFFRVDIRSIRWWEPWLGLATFPPNDPDLPAAKRGTSTEVGNRHLESKDVSPMGLKDHNGREGQLRQLVTWCGKRAASTVASALRCLLGSCTVNSVGILTYHRVVPWANRVPAPTWNVTPRRLLAQLRGLLAQGYCAWPLRKALDFSRAGRPVPPRVFVVTFDDGYQNFYRHAWPVLRCLNVPATVFVATAYLDSAEPFSFDDWPAAGSHRVAEEAWRPLRSAECREMLAGGLIDLGSHTHTHRNFRGQPDTLRQELATSIEVLRTRFGLGDVTFSFPFGIAGPELAEAAQQTGVLCGLTTEPVPAGLGEDPFTWGRFGIEENDNAVTIAAKLDGWYSLARSIWSRLRGGRGRTDWRSLSAPDTTRRPGEVCA
jgi:peptidoglycan/xylan/chitin deacetylase (PgdA/CDA1 family)